MRHELGDLHSLALAYTHKPKKEGAAMLVLWFYSTPDDKVTLRLCAQRGRSDVDGINARTWLELMSNDMLVGALPCRNIYHAVTTFTQVMYMLDTEGGLTDEVHALFNH